MMRSNTADEANYDFTSPYPKPQFDYPTAHSRTSLPSHGTRSPSPTPSEVEEANQPFIPRKLWTLEFYKRPKVILWMILFIIIGIFTVLITIYHQQIEDWLRPAANWMQHLKFGWLIPIAILFVISFPPLFGHEIVAVLAGNVWGLWEGFGIVCAGTLIGEIGNFYAFRYLCTARGDKLEKDSFFYGCLARTVREGGFFVAVMARLSVIPGHFTTAVFATCGMNIFIFILAAILSLPKQFVTVYLGVLLEQSANGSQPSKKSKLISDLVVVLSVIITSVAMWYILRKMRGHRLAVIRERRKRLAGPAGMKPYNSDEEGRVPLTGGRRHGGHESTSSLVSNDVFNPGISDAELAGQPMQVGYEANGYGYTGRDPVAPIPQRWDERGRAVDMQEDHLRYSGAYDDPYAYNSYPPSRHMPSSTSPAAAPVKASPPTSYAPPTSPPPHLRPANVSPFGQAPSQPQPQLPSHPVTTFAPPSGPPPGVQPIHPQPVASHSSNPSQDTVVPTIAIPPPPAPAPAPGRPPSYTSVAPPTIQVTHQDSQTPQSPFEDSNAIRIPAHVRRYQLSDGDNSFRTTQYTSDGESVSTVHPSDVGGGHSHGQEGSDSSFYSAHSRAGTNEPDLR